jgi:hypothetical protein
VAPTEDYRNDLLIPDRDSQDESPGPSENGTGYLFALNTLFAFFAAISVPVAAQIAAGFQIAEVLGKRAPGWLWIVFVLLVLVSTTVARVTHERNMRQARYARTATSSGSYDRTLTVLYVVSLLASSALGYFVAKVLGSA